MQRRVASAPAFAQARFNISEETSDGVFPSGGSNGGISGCGSGVVDALWEQENTSVDEFLVASVKQKVVNRKEKELERSVSANAGLESWDDDFFVEGDEQEGVTMTKASEGLKRGGGGMTGLKVPEFVNNVQDTLRVDSENLRKFALHIEDLKLIYMDALDISFGLDFECPEKVAPITREYQKTLDTAKVLINLGDFNDHDEKMETDDLHLTVLGELLGESLNAGDLKTLAMASLKMQFNCEYVQLLIKNIGPVKGRLNDYVKELRKISRELA